jgi:dCMP deaminase
MNWDKYFLEICDSVAKKSSCLSRQIGAIIVRDNSIISTGYNGPARGIPHCGRDRFKKDNSLYSELNNNYGELQLYQAEFDCPRKLMNFPSGEGMHWCTAQHAEENCISNAARNGVSTVNSTLYLNSVIPCKNCFSTLINSGIVEIVCVEDTIYDKYSKFIIENSSIKIRKFNLC